MQDLSHQLLLACFPGKLDALQVLLAHSGVANLDLNTPLPSRDDTQRLTPLSVAAILNNPSACKLLIKSGAKANQADGGGGRSAMHWATLAGHLSVVKCLLANGAKPHVMDSEV